MPRLTIACPEALCAAANQLAVALGGSIIEITTFDQSTWSDQSGALYSCASLEASDSWIEYSQQPVTRPAWDIDQQIDMAAALSAQSSVLLWKSSDNLPPPTATQEKIVVIVGLDGFIALEILGIAQATIELGDHK